MIKECTKITVFHLVLTIIVVISGFIIFDENYPVGDMETTKLVEVQMVKIKISERYVHVFKNNITDEIIEVETTKNEYKKLGEKGGSKYNPTLDGHTWKYSGGGIPVYLISAPELNDNEYYIIDSSVASGTEEVMIKLPNENIKKIKKKDL